MARRARIDGGADVRPPSARAAARAVERATRRRVAVVLAALALACGAGAFPVRLLAPRAAGADAIDDERARLVDAPPSTWPDRVAELAKSPGRLGAVVGPLLRDRDPRRAKAGAFCAAWLCDHPQAGGRVSLEDDVLRRAARDPAFVAELRGFLSTDGAGWTRLLSVARELLGATGADASLVVSAVWIMRYEATASNARDLLEVWDQSDDPAVKAAAGDSLAALLGTSFAKPEDARRYFDANRGRSLFEWVRDLSAAKDRPDAPLLRRLLAEVRGNLERVTGADGLRGYLLEPSTPWPEVRRLAAKRAAELVQSTSAWARLFVEAVDAETDVEALTTLLDAFDRLGDVGGHDVRAFVERTAERLEARPPPVDPVAVRFLSILGRLGTPAQLHRAFATLAERRASAPVFAAWLDAAASLGGCGTDVRELHRRRRAATGPEDVALRVSALEALAKGVVAASGDVADEAQRSGAFLVEVLAPRRAGEVGAADPAFAPGLDERAAAARSLEAFPSAAAVAALEARAVDPVEDVGLARLCASVLGRLAAKGAESDAAFDALVRVAGASGTSAARVSAVDDLSRLSREVSSDDRRDRLVGGLRAALGSHAPVEVRRAAARAAALAADAGAIAGVFALVAEDFASAGADGPAPTGPDSGLWSADRLVRAVTARDADSDDTIVRECRDLFDRGQGAAGAAISLAESAADAGGGRPALQALRATLFRRQERWADRTLDERVDDLEAARRVLTSALRALTDADRAEPPWVRVAAIDEDVVTSLLRLRVRQLAAIPDESAFDVRRLEVRRGLEQALRSAFEVESRSRAVELAVAADAAALERLRGAASTDVRRGALIDSARAEARRGEPSADLELARRHLAEARALEPTADEMKEIERIAGTLDAVRSPPGPK